MRNFNKWFETLTDTIINPSTFIDFNKVCTNVDAIKVELNILNSIIGSKNIKKEFSSVCKKYPEVIKTLPILIAAREKEIKYREEETKTINFNKKEYNEKDIKEYAEFLEKTGVFELMQKKKILNIVDYVTGVEVGIDTNARKNRVGKMMEELVEYYLLASKLELNKTYFKQMTSKKIEQQWGVDLSLLTNSKNAIKKFDFVVKMKNTIYGIEVNFYSSSGSKLNETARSYKLIGQETNNIKNFKFVWLTDGKGWYDAKNNLEDTFKELEDIYNINDMKNGIMEKVFQ